MNEDKLVEIEDCVKRAEVLSGHLKNHVTDLIAEVRRLNTTIDELEGKIDEVAGTGFYDKVDDHP